MCLSELAQLSVIKKSVLTEMLMELSKNDRVAVKIQFSYRKAASSCGAITVQKLNLHNPKVGEN